MPFNLKKIKKVAITSTEKLLEKEREELALEPAKNMPAAKLLEVDHKPAIKETTEAQFGHGEDNEAKSILEKNLERPEMPLLYVPAISGVVSDAIVDRRKEFKGGKSTTKNDWTLDNTNKDGNLPEWPNTPKKSDRITLTNDHRRKSKDPVTSEFKQNMQKVAYAIKTGKTLEFDNKIMNVLKVAMKQGRDLDDSEKQIVSQLKKERTESVLKNIKN